jgi:hypothetical protein
MMSRPYGVAITSQSVSFESNRANPSWCLVVTTMYFMPACFAMRTHASGSNFVGLNRVRNWSYVSMGMRPLCRIHSP